MTLAMALGKFNILHIGHLAAFRLALKHADKLIVVFSNGNANADYSLRLAIAKSMLKLFMPEEASRIDFMLGDFKAVLLCEPDYFVCGSDRASSFRKSFHGKHCQVLEMLRAEDGVSTTYIRAELNAGRQPWFISNKLLPLARESAKQYAQRAKAKNEARTICSSVHRLS